MKCKNCKHWEPPENPQNYFMGQCVNNKNCPGYDWYENFPRDGCIPTDPMCGLETGPEFGCVNFESI